MLGGATGADSRADDEAAEIVARYFRFSATRERPVEMDVDGPTSGDASGVGGSLG